MPKFGAYPNLVAENLGATDQVVFNDSGVTKRMDASELGEGLRRLGGVINVKDYGAVGDNSADDSAAIQAALDAVGTGGTVYFPVGSYKIVTALTCTQYGVHIVGEGGGTYVESSPYHGAVLVGTTASMKILSVTNKVADNINHVGPHVENLGFVGTTTMTGLYIKLNNRWVVENCWFRTLAVGLDVDADSSTSGGATSGGDASWGLSFQNVYKVCTRGLRSIHGAGFMMVGGCVDIAAGGIGLELQTGDQHRVVGVKFDDGAYAIKAFGGFTSITDCQFESQTTACVWFGAGDASNGADGRWHRAIGCHFSGSAAGVLIDSTEVHPPMLIGSTYGNGTLPRIVDNTSPAIGYRLIGDQMGTYASQAGPVTSSTQIGNSTNRIERCETLLCNPVGGAFNVTLPASTYTLMPMRGRRQTIKKIDSGGNNVTILPNASETIDGASSYLLNTPYESVTLESDGTNWWSV